MVVTEVLMYITLFASLFFEVFLLITFIEHVNTPAPKALKKNAKNLPSAAIIVPCWNEENTIKGTIESLLALEYPTEKMHIYAVNDGSTDNTAQVLKEYENNPRITVLHKENGGKHTAMNEALAHATQDIIGCLDADSFVEPDALLYVAAHFANPRVAAVTPSIKIFKPRTLLQVLQKAEYAISIFVRNTFARENALFITPGPFSFFRRSDVEEVGQWRHAHGTEDLEMCLRLQTRHKIVTNEPRAIVHTTSPATFKALYKQRVRWTFGFLKNARDYSHLFFNSRHSTLGVFILPLSYFSIFAGTFLFFSLVVNTLTHIFERVVRVYTVGITPPTLHIDLFYAPTGVLLTVVLALIVLTLTVMALGKYMSNDRPLSLDMLLYIALYGFITPFWLTASIYKAVTQRSVHWR